MKIQHWAVHSIAIALTFFAVGLAEAKINKSTFGGVAIDGYDPVAYHTQGQAVEGKKSFQEEYQGAKWRFASAENRDLFKANPAKYAPAYGGYCAYGIAKGSLYDIDPKAFSVVAGKLYLNYSLDVQKKWVADQAKFIQTANRNWPNLKK